MKKRTISETILALGAAGLLTVSCQTVGAPGGRAAPESDGERRDSFIERGYDSTLRHGVDADDYEAFIKSHGEPQATSRKAIVNPHDRVTDEELILVYGQYELRYYVYSKRELWRPPKSLLMAALSREGGSYLFGVRIGMEEAAVLDILGLPDSRGESVDVEGSSGHRLRLGFKEGKLSSIVWDYSRE